DMPQICFPVDLYLKWHAGGRPANKGEPADPPHSTRPSRRGGGRTARVGDRGVANSGPALSLNPSVLPGILAD
ncbi:MAG: hypothetical protein ABI142_10630, partial [Bryocella sp.]